MSGESGEDHFNDQNSRESLESLQMTKLRLECNVIESSIKKPVFYRTLEFWSSVVTFLATSTAILISVWTFVQSIKTQNLTDRERVADLGLKVISLNGDVEKLTAQLDLSKTKQAELNTDNLRLQAESGKLAVANGKLQNEITKSNLDLELIKAKTDEEIIKKIPNPTAIAMYYIRNNTRETQLVRIDTLEIRTVPPNESVITYRRILDLPTLHFCQASTKEGAVPNFKSARVNLFRAWNITAGGVWTINEKSVQFSARGGADPVEADIY